MGSPPLFWDGCRWGSAWHDDRGYHGRGDAGSTFTGALLVLGRPSHDPGLLGLLHVTLTTSVHGFEALNAITSPLKLKRKSHRFMKPASVMLAFLQPTVVARSFDMLHCIPGGAGKQDE